MAKVRFFYFQIYFCCSTLFVLLLNSWCCKAHFLFVEQQQQEPPPSNDARKQAQERRRLAPCREEAYRCSTTLTSIFGGSSYIMHSQSFFQSCTEMCVPAFMAELRNSFGWKCGPCAVQLIQGGTTSALSATGKDLAISRPSLSTTDDLLLLFLSRTDDLLPLRLDGWTAGPACLKSDNDQGKCHVVEDCIQWEGDYCLGFRYDAATEFMDTNGNLDGLDLATAVFYRIVQPDEPSQYSFNLRCASGTDQCHPAWAILTAVRNANNENPIGDSATESYDGIRESRFPSVYGEAGDMLLLYMALDDGFATGTNLIDVLPPGGTGWLEQVIGEDEAGYLFFEDLETSGETGSRTTAGFGTSPTKDVMISLIVRKKL